MAMLQYLRYERLGLHLANASAKITPNAFNQGYNLRILYLHPAASFGGASKSLIEIFSLLKEVGVTGTVVTPRGSAAQSFGAAGMNVHPVMGISQFDNTRYGHYRGLRWLILLREFFFMPSSLLAIWKLRHEKFDLVHVNEVTLLPVGLFAKYIFRIPMVVHVRSVQRGDVNDWRTRTLKRLLKSHANAVVAIDQTVAKSLGEGLDSLVIHNGLRVNINQTKTVAPRMGSEIRIGFLGVLIGLKGIYELLESIKILKEREVRVKCLIAGENAREVHGIRGWLLKRAGFSRDVKSELLSYISKHKLQNEVQLLGFRDRVEELYSQLDILCFASHLNAAGRPVFEAAFYGVPSVVAVSDPFPDAVIHNVTGIAIPRPEPVLLANALQRLAEDEEFRLRLGRAARIWAYKNFSIENSARDVLEVYRLLIDQFRTR